MQKQPDIALDTRGVASDEELRLANDLMAKVHCSDYFEGLEWLETSGARYPNFQREHTRVALCQGELAGALRINTETIRLGEARLKTGGLGWVTTVPAFRRRGVARALLGNALSYMAQRGYHVSMLFGIPNFYHRFGFVTTLVDYAIAVSSAEAVAASRAGYKLRAGKPGDIRAIQKIHNVCDAGVACSLLRTAGHMSNRWDQWGKHLHVLTTEAGKVVAYAIAYRGADELTVSDVGVARAGEHGPAEQDVNQALLAACAQLARREYVGRIRVLAPPPNPFARFLLQFTSTHEAHVVRDRGGMMAFVNLGETLESLTPEWDEQLAHSALAGRRAEFVLCVERAQYRVRANRGVVDVTPCTGKNKIGLTAEELMHLVTGYRHAADILDARRRAITGEARAFFLTLFPKRDPYVWPCDRF